jgi:glycosyltransferase involved in cell wall biosynthesis
MGHEARLFMHSAQHETLSDLIEADYFFYAIEGKVGTEINRIVAMQRMLKAIQTFQPDLIYLRYSMYVYPAHRLMDIAPVVEEINTDDLAQHEQLGWIYSLYNRLTRGIFLRRVHGLVTVSHELAASYAFAPYRKPTCVIANGCELNEFHQLPAPSNQVPHLVFIGSPGYSWNGVDKLIDLAFRFPDIHIDIVGYDTLSEFGPLPDNLTLHGYLSTQEYQQVLADADIAISSLALHRKQMEEASPLKSREYLAFGLPLVVAYIDTDLDDVNCGFLLKIPNKEDNIQTHAQSIRDFAYRMRGHRVDRELLKKHIDADQKEATRLAFFEKLLEKRS